MVEKVNELDKNLVEEFTKHFNTILIHARTAMERYDNLKCCANCKYYTSLKCLKLQEPMLDATGLCNLWEYDNITPDQRLKRREKC